MSCVSKTVGFALLAAVPLACPSIAAAAPVAPEPPPEEPPSGATFLDTVTVTATRGEDLVGDVPGTVTVTDEEGIRRFLMRDLRDLVAHEPGVSVESSPGGGGLGGFNIRGIGGNRVLTRIDGVPAAESFEFGHFVVPSFVLDPQSLSRVEILRGPGSSLYGSNALGGVVSFETVDPIDLVTSGGSPFVGLSTAWDGRSAEVSSAALVASSRPSWQALAAVNSAAGRERSTQGRVDARDSTRTVPDPQRSRTLGFLAKLVHQGSLRDEVELAVETFARQGETTLLSDLGAIDLGSIFGFPPTVTYVVDKTSSTARDEQSRHRLSIEGRHGGRGLDHLQWRLYSVASSTEQRTAESRITTLGGGAFGAPATSGVRRLGLVSFDQDSLGLELEARHAPGGDSGHLLTLGLATNLDRFDQLRDRVERDAGGEILPPSDGLTYPTRYVPRSRVWEAGVFAQAEFPLAGDRVTLVPGLRYDRMELVVDDHDEIFFDGNDGAPPPVELAETALSPKLALIAELTPRVSLSALYAHGFRAPPYSAINSGFTHLAGGLTRLPNPDLRPEESDGFELGVRVRASRVGASVALFDNYYDGFIELVDLGRNETTGLIEFQQQNIAAARIRGVEASADGHRGDLWYWRASLAWIEGEDRARSEPLNSISPPQAVVLVRRGSGGERLETSLAARFVAAKERKDIDSRTTSQFAPPGYATLDLYSTWQASRRIVLAAGLRNLTDAVYWEWPDARGRAIDAPGLERFTSAGRSISVALRYRN